MRKLLVTGLGGFVAGSVLQQAVQRGTWDVYALAHREPKATYEGIKCTTLDLCDLAHLRRVFESLAPDAVIHTAARADIDYCEEHPDEAKCINEDVPRELARLSQNIGARLVHCSTDTVFDGTKGMYTERDAPGPLNVYAQTKANAEAAVLDLAPNSVVARLSLVMGLSVLGTGNSFLARLLDDLENGRPGKFLTNEIRTPLDVITAGRALLELAEIQFAGILHLAGSTRLSRFDMARQVAERLGHSPKLIHPVDLSAMPGRAPRPPDASLDNTLAKRLLGTPMRTLLDGLDLVLGKTK